MSYMLTRKGHALNNRAIKGEPVFDYARKMTSQKRGYLSGGGSPWPLGLG
jgi:hypothetical protein